MYNHRKLWIGSSSLLGYHALLGLLGEYSKAGSENLAI